MKVLNFDDTYSLAEALIESTSSKIETCVVGKYNIIDNLLRDLVSIDSAFRLVNVFICDDDEDLDFVLEIDSEWGIYVYEYENGVNISGDAIFISSESKSSIIKNCYSDAIFEYRINDFEECDGDCEHCCFDDNEYITEPSYSKDGTLHGFTRSKSDNNSYYSESFYSSDPELVIKQLNNYKY